MTNTLKALAGAVTNNLLEIALYVAISFGLPYIAFIYGDWRSAITVFIFTQIVLLFLALREGSN